MSDFSPTPSGLATAERCQLQYYFFNVLRLKFPPGFAREYGHVLHGVLLEKDQKAKIETGQYRPIEELKESFADGFRGAVKEVPDEDDEIQRLGSREKAYSDYQGFGLRTIDKYNENRNALSGRAVEVSFEVPCGDARIHGRIDVDVADTRIRDLKTRDITKKGSRRVTQEAVDEDTQIAAYGYAKAKLSGVDDQFTDHVIAYKAAAPEIVTLSTVRQSQDHRVIEDKVTILHKIYDAGAFYPTGRNSWVCQQKWCGAWQAGWARTDGFEGCPFGQRAKVSVAIGAPKGE